MIEVDPRSQLSLKPSLGTAQFIQPLDGGLGLTLDPPQQLFACWDILDETHDNPSGPNSILVVANLIHDTTTCTGD